MRLGQIRCCARSSCRKAFWVDRGDQFVTCPDCRMPFKGGDLGPIQPLPHARERKLGTGDVNAHTKIADPNEVV